MDALLSNLFYSIYNVTCYVTCELVWHSSFIIYGILEMEICCLLYSLCRHEGENSVRGELQMYTHLGQDCGIPRDDFA
jgi:hypothetical protein